MKARLNLHAETTYNNWTTKDNIFFVPWLVKCQIVLDFTSDRTLIGITACSQIAIWRGVSAVRSQTDRTVSQFVNWEKVTSRKDLAWFPTATIRFSVIFTGENLDLLFFTMWDPFTGNAVYWSDTWSGCFGKNFNNKLSKYNVDIIPTVAFIAP